jgi:hypothetical protein
MASADLEFDTDKLLNNDNEIYRLKKEIEELQYQIEREKREGERLKQILAGGTGTSHALPLYYLLFNKSQQSINPCSR